MTEQKQESASVRSQMCMHCLQEIPEDPVEIDPEAPVCDLCGQSVEGDQ